MRSSHLPQAPFFRKNDVIGIVLTCNHLAEVFSLAAVLFVDKNGIPGLSIGQRPINIPLSRHEITEGKQIHKWAFPEAPASHIGERMRRA